jgi:hypothetical protein
MEKVLMKPKSQKYLFVSLLILILLVGTACAKDKGQTTPPELPEDVDSLVLLAQFDLTLKTNVDIEKISVVSVEETKFMDASLGVPEPGVEYPAVVTPGFIIILDADGDEYEYHASGERVVQVPQE